MLGNDTDAIFQLGDPISTTSVVFNRIWYKSYGGHDPDMNLLAKKRTIYRGLEINIYYVGTKTLIWYARYSLAKLCNGPWNEQINKLVYFVFKMSQISSRINSPWKMVFLQGRSQAFPDSGFRLIFRHLGCSFLGKFLITKWAMNEGSKAFGHCVWNISEKAIHIFWPKYDNSPTWGSLK